MGHALKPCGLTADVKGDDLPVGIGDRPAVNAFLRNLPGPAALFGLKRESKLPRSAANATVQCEHFEARQG
jgi:hypothetical protein